MQTTFLYICLVALFTMTAVAGEERFSSGLLKTVENPAKKFYGRAPEGAIEAFIDEEFNEIAAFSRSYSWEKTNVVKDSTHTHASFDLKYLNRKVVDRNLKVNAGNDGSIESASNNFSMPFVLNLPDTQTTTGRAKTLREKLWSEWEGKLGKIQGDIKIEPVIWVDPETHVGYPAFDVLVIIDRPWTLRHFIVHEETGLVLEEKNIARNASASVKVFKNSPYGSASPDSVTLSDLNDTSSLRNSYLWVRRERYASGNANPETTEVTPTDYTGGSCAGTFNNSPTPAQYDYECNSNEEGTNCHCNMAFDAVNVYYHISNFRSRIDSYLSQLGASVDWTYDSPTNPYTGATNTFSVLINPVSLPSEIGEAANNALYIGSPCRSDGSMDRCLVFLRPAALSTSASQTNCSQSSSTLFDLAREAIVVAHEYQHYVTDMVTRIAFSSSSTPKVGDAIHEGYSDYMAASYVTDLVSTNATLVGEYALQQCTPLQRQMNVLRVYDDTDTSNSEDIHLPGLSWASGFWKLRTEYGREVADLLALKSLFFLSTTPGFIESVEAIVKADQALYAGAHVERIRTLFYTELRFTGSNTLPASGLGEVGFKGCAAVHNARRPQGTTLFIVFAYFLSVIAVGRTWVRRRKAL